MLHKFVLHHELARAELLQSSANYSTYTNLDDVHPFLFEANKYNVGIWIFESVMLSDGTNTVFAALFNEAGAQVSNSEISTTSSNYTLQRSAGIHLVDGQIYHQRIKTSTTITTNWGSTKPRLIFEANQPWGERTQSEIVLFSDNAGPFETWGLGPTSPVSVSAGWGNGELFLFNKANWAGDTKVYYEAYFKSQTGTFAAESALISHTNTTIVNDSELDTTSTTFVRIRSAEFFANITDGHELKAWLDTSATLEADRAVMKHAKLIFQIPSSNKMEVHHPLSAFYLSADQTSYVKYVSSRVWSDPSKWTDSAVTNVFFEALLDAASTQTVYQALSLWVDPTTDIGTISGTEISSTSTSPTRIRSADIKATLWALGRVLLQSRWRVSGGSTGNDILTGGKLIFIYNNPNPGTFDVSLTAATTTGFDLSLSDRTREVADYLTILESVTTNVTGGGGPVTFTASVSDTLTITESTSALRISNASVFDALTITESVTTLRSTFASVFDALGITENVARTRTAQSMSFLSDDFNDNNLSAATWLNWGGAEVVNTNQRLEISVLSGGANYQGMETIGSYNMTGQEVRITVLDAGNQALTSLEVSMAVRQDVNNTVFLLISGNNLIAYRKVSGVNQYITQVAYSAATVKYIRFRENSGVMYWEYSANGHSWTTLHNETSPITLDAVGVEIVAGVYATEATGTTVIFDNFNIFAFEVSDSLGITENVTTQLILGTFTASVSDTFTITESVTTLRTLNTSVVDTLTITESVVPVNTITQFTFDAVTITENVAATFVGAAFSASVFDALTITENVTLLETSFVSVSDTLTIAETVATLRITHQSVSDLLSISESVTAVLTLNQSVNDALGISESVVLLRVANQSVFDTVTIAETVTTQRNTSASVFDSLTITESIAAQLGTFTASVFDTISIAESVTPIIEGGGLGVTNISITENVTLQLIQTTYPVSVSDTITISEATTHENNIFVESKLERKFPKVRATATSGNSNNVSLDVTLPSGYQAGDLLIIALAVSGSNIGISAPSGWAEVASANPLSWVFWKVADGSEGTFVDVGNLLVRRYAAVSYAIYDHTGATPIEGSGTTGLNPPSVNPSWAEAIDALWLTFATTQGTDGAFSAAPTGFTDLIVRESIDGIAGTTQATIATARKEDTSVTLDPDSFTHSGPLISETSRTVAVSGDVGVSQGVTQVGITEVVTTSVTRAVSVSDTIGITESVAAQTTLTQSVSDTITIAEVVTRANTANVAVNDPIGITEFVSPNAVYTAVVFDAIGIAETATAQQVITASVSDTISITEALTTNITRNVVTFDTVTLSEAVTADSSFQVSVFDALTVTESVQRVLTTSATVSDTIGITESVNNSVTRFTSVNTSVVVSESVLPQRVHLASVFDALTITESQAFRIEATYTADVFDLITMLEVISNEVNARASVTDQITIAENVNPNKIFNAQLLWDSIVMSDVVTDRETIRFSPEPPKYRPRGLRGDIKRRGKGSAIINETWSGSAERLGSRGTVKSR